MNAATHILSHLPRPALRRLCSSDDHGVPASNSALRARLSSEFAGDLASLLNRLRRAELDRVAEAAVRGDPDTAESADCTVSEMRQRLWLWGARLEAGSGEHIGSAYQPAPIVLGDKLVQLGRVRGHMPDCVTWPRPVPPPREVRSLPEPESVEALCRNATELLGVRLGARGSDKGFYGTLIAELLGVRELGLPGADFLGQVEVKSVPVVRDRSGWWRVKEDPAIAMEHAAPLDKLRCVLWIARVADDPESPLLSWYLQSFADDIAAMAKRHLHTRPKGPKGATTRGWYLHKRFFVESGMLASLNG